MERYNPLSEGHIERVGRTKINARPIYALVEPIDTNAVRTLAEYKYVEGKYTTEEGRIVRGWVYNPPYPEATEPEPEVVAEPEVAPEPEPTPEPETFECQDECERCGAKGDDLQVFDSDSEVYGVICPCGNMWLAPKQP
jgi:hypothetical protein